MEEMTTRERRLDRKRKRAKEISYIMLGINYALLSWASVSLILLISQCLDDYFGENPNASSLLTTPYHIRSTLVGFLVSIPQVIGAQKLYTGALTGTTPNDARCKLVYFHQKVQCVFQVLDLFACLDASSTFAIVNLGSIVVGINNFFAPDARLNHWIYVFATLFRLGCWTVVNKFWRLLKGLS